MWAAGWSGVKMSQVFAGRGGGAEIFILEWGIILLARGIILLGESHNFEVKIKTA